MISPRWRKVFRDLWNNKTRTLLVILSIAVGVAAIGVIAGTYIIISRELPGAYARVNPAGANLFTSPFDDEVLQVIRNMGVVKDLEGRFTLRAKATSTAVEDKDITITVIPNFQDMRINKILPQNGAWPPQKGEILIERASLPLLRAKIGDTITIDTPDGKKRDLKISGTVHDISGPAGSFTNRVSGYINFDTLELLNYPREYNELLFTVDGTPPLRPKVKTIANQISNKIEKGDRNVYSIVLANPGRLWFEAFIGPMVSILGIIGLIILFMSSLLVINTISAIMAQQVRQIGIMKAVGARSGQIIVMYMATMLIIGLLALAVAVPLGNLWTRSSVTFLARIINFDIASYTVPRPVLILQIAVSLFLPLIAASFSIVQGARITVREAISDYGLSRINFGDSFFDQLIGKIRGIPRPQLLSLRNTFRQKGRLILTLITLSLAGAIFIGVMSVYASLTRTLDQALQYYGFDVVFQFNRAYRVDQILNTIKGVEGVSAAETWDATNMRIVLPDGSESDNIVLIGPPAETELIHPILLEGRWFKPGDQNQIILNSEVSRVAPGIKVGDSIDIKIEDKTSTWTVAGIIRSVLSGPTAYVTSQDFANTLSRYGQAGSVYVKVRNEDIRYQQAMATILTEKFERNGIKVGSSNEVAVLRLTAINQYSVIFVFLMLMVILLTVVGGLGLAGTMSLNVLERTREIGVLRAVGASNDDILQIVILEGMLIGAISWLIGLLLAFPLGWILGQAVGNGFLNEPLRLTYSIIGVIIWLIIVLVLSAIASYIPARRAGQLTVRDVLAYE